MIEKLGGQPVYKLERIIGERYPTTEDIVRKINEIIDSVNKLGGGK